METIFYYNNMLELGFKRIKMTDSVFFEKNRYEWFLVQLQYQNFVFDWDCETKKVELIRYSEDLEVNSGANRMATMKIKTMDQLKFMIDFITSKENKVFEFPETD